MTIKFLSAGYNQSLRGSDFARRYPAEYQRSSTRPAEADIDTTPTIAMTDKSLQDAAYEAIRAGVQSDSKSRKSTRADSENSFSYPREIYRPKPLYVGSRPSAFKPPASKEPVSSKSHSDTKDRQDAMVGMLKLNSTPVG